MLQHPVFHIRTACDSGVDGITAMLDSAGIRADECDDVYRGLARLCIQPGAPTRIVLVGVDDLTEEELEFFRQVRRSRGDLQVYVYGGERFEARIASAIREGATGRFDKQVLANLTWSECGSSGQITEHDNKPRERAASEPCPSESDPIARSLDTDSIAAISTPDELDVPGSDAADEDRHAATEFHDEPTDEHEDEDDEQSIVRVPWLRRDDAPARQKPARPTRTRRDGITEPEARRTGPESSQPLLTDDELRALMGDGDPDESWMDMDESDHEGGGPQELRP